MILGEITYTVIQLFIICSRSRILLFALYNTGYTYHTYIQILHYKVVRMPPNGMCKKPLAGRPPVLYIYEFKSKIILLINGPSTNTV